jgi:hypothetical protein
MHSLPPSPTCWLQDLIVYAVITVCDVGSLALCCVLAIVSLYYLILYKLQVGAGGIGAATRDQGHE